MSDDTFKKLLERVDEHFAHKEHVSSQILKELMSQMKSMQEDVQSLTHKLDTSITLLKNEMSVRHIEVDNAIENVRAKTDRHDKIVTAVQQVVFYAILVAGLATIGIKAI